MAASELDRLRGENAELRRRLETVDAELVDLRNDALARRTEVRQLAESLPTAVSRRALVAQMTKDAVAHPDKKGLATRAMRKLGRAPRRLAHVLGLGPKALPPGPPVEPANAPPAE
ncbi:MAG: hypothetical protein AAGA42_13185 [Actinomycetota bacterium]